MAGGKTESADIAGTAREVFSKYNIRYIITHNDTYRDFIEGQLGLDVHYEDELVRVYSIGTNEGRSLHPAGILIGSRDRMPHTYDMLMSDPQKPIY